MKKGGSKKRAAMKEWGIIKCHSFARLYDDHGCLLRHVSDIKLILVTILLVRCNRSRVTSIFGHCQSETR
jgi:hypothetical protein